MATSTVNKKRFLEYLGRKVSDRDIQEKLPMIGAVVENWGDKEFVIEVSPNRPDFFSEEGLARAFSSFMGIKTGLAKYNVKKSGYNTKVEKVLKIWPYAVTAIVRGVKFDEEKVRSIIQLQEKIGATLLRNRKKGGMGIYPLDKIKPPITFTTRPADAIIFRPLDFGNALNGRQILQRHPIGMEYGYIIEKEKEFPIFIDSAGTIMSMPPIINSEDIGRITEKSRDVFIEATGPDLKTLMVAINIFATALADMGGQINSMEMIYPNKKLTVPNLKPGRMKLDVGYINKLLGLKLKAGEAKKLLERMGYGVEGNTVLIPAYRNDVLHQVDLAEDVAIAYGYEKFKEEIPQVSTIGEESPDTIVSRKVSEILAGVGFLECNNYHLSNEGVLLDKMNLPKMELIKTKNSVNTEYDTLRNAITPGLLKILSENKHNPSPQKLFEVGLTFGKTKGVEELGLAVVISHSTTDFSEIKSIAEALFMALGKQVKIKETNSPSFIDGRTATIMVDGKNVGIIGEIHPQVLNNFELENPVTAFEIDLGALHLS